MDILQICPNYSTMGGVPHYVRNISERLAKDHEVTVYTLDPLNKYPRNETLNDVKIRRFKRFVFNRAYFFSWELFFEIRKNEFEIIHAHDYHAFPMHASIFSKRKKLILSPHFHGGSYSTFRTSLLNILNITGSIILNNSNSIICVSEYEKKLLLQKLNINDNKINVIPCGIDINEFKNFPKMEKENTKKIILYVGRLEKYKNIHYLLEALWKLDGFKLIIVGKGPMKEYLITRAKQLNILNNIEFYQDIPREQLLKLYSISDIFILLSVYEAYSMVVSEAITMGIACLVSKTSALQEWIDNKICYGIKLPINIENLVDKIKHITTKFKLNNEIKYKSDKIIDWSNVVKRIVSIYEE